MQAQMFDEFARQYPRRESLPLFYIDTRYVASVRATTPDTTFIAIDGPSPQLIQCFLRVGTGRYEPAVFSPEQWYWHPVKPKQFVPGINTLQGIVMAGDACRDASQIKTYRPDFDRSVYSIVKEVNPGYGTKPGLYEPGALIGGVRAERYDIVVTGEALYGPANPDFLKVDITCLFSPMLELKSVQFK